MKRTQHVWLIGLGVVACLACMIGGLSKTPVQAQTATDDGLFTVYTYIDYDGSNVYASSYYDPDDSELEVLTSQSEWQLSGGSYNDYGAGDSFSSGVPPGYTYNAVFMYSIEYEYFDDDEYNSDCQLDTECTGDDYPNGYASIDVPYPPPQIQSISPHFDVQGASGTIHVQGQYLQDSSGTLSAYFLDNDISVSVNSGATGSDAYLSYTISPIASIGTHQLVLQNSGGESEPATFTVNSATGNNACAVTSNPHAGYSSIVSTGTPGSGKVSVSFSGTDFSALTPSVPYGPYSTRESIAAHVAALVTQNYFRYGLSAKAFGSNVVYSGNTALGTVSNTVTANPGTSPSFTTPASPTAATAAENLCNSAFSTAGSVAAIYFVDPYRVLGNNPSSTTIDTTTVLSSLPSTTGCDVKGTSSCAAGLIRDGSSTAIIVVQEAQPNTVQLSVNSDSGATLFQYDPNFLNCPPTGGGNTLNCPTTAGVTTLPVTPTAYNDSYYALALVLAPSDSSSTINSSENLVNVNLRATVNSTSNPASMYGTLSLSYPIAVLVHGIWGSDKSLNDDGTANTIGDYLRANGYDSDWVFPVCYSSYVTWYATTDTVPPNLNPNGIACEQTSATAIANKLAGTVYPTYDLHHVVGGRVDIIAHSMGGLAARNYAGLPNYQSDPRSRNLGAIHNLITIDTPIQGSGLATYMLGQAGQPLLSNSYGLYSATILAKANCYPGQTGRDCFYAAKIPIASPAIDPLTGQPFSDTTGAVYSLQPSVIKQLQSSPIKPVNSTWTAISANFSESYGSQTSALRFVLQNLINNFYSPDQSPPTLTAEINDPAGTNDVIVGTSSQQTTGYTGVAPDFICAPLNDSCPIGGDLEHTATPNLPAFTSILPAWSDADVLHSPDVNKAIKEALRR